MSTELQEQLQNYFINVAPLPELISHIDKLLYCLVYYYGIEELKDFHIIYDDMYRFKQVLQNFENESAGQRTKE